MIRRLALFLALGAPAAAQAEPVTLVRCAAGGCTCAPSDLGPADLAARAGIAPPTDPAAAVLLERDGTLSWSTLSPQRLDLEMGGDGICLPGRDLFLTGPASAAPGNASAAPPAGASPPAPRAPTPIDPAIGQCPMTPRDGTWQPTLVAQDVDACPETMRATIAPLISPSLAPRPIAWGGGFDPEALSIGPSGISWTQIGPCNWGGRAPVPGGALKAKIRFQANLINPEKAGATVTVDIGLAAQDAQTQEILAQAGLAACAAKMRFEINRIGE